jgi:hypothetical protein
MGKTMVGQYAAAAEALRRDIASGALAPGAWLPSEAQVMQIYQVSRYGAREAIKRLAGEGLIVVVDGKGSYVRARRDRAAHADLRGLRHAHGRVRYRDAEAEHWHPSEDPACYRSTATPPGKDLRDLSTKPDRDRQGRHIVVQAQLNLIPVQGHRPAPPLVIRPTGSPSRSTRTIGATRGWLPSPGGGYEVGAEADGARHALTGGDSLDVMKHQGSTAQRAERTRPLIRGQRDQMHRARGLAYHAGAIADQHHRLCRSHRTRAAATMPLARAHRATPARWGHGRPPVGSKATPGPGEGSADGPRRGRGLSGRCTPAPP